MLDSDLIVSQETDASILADFYCGLQRMDDYIHDGSLQQFLDNNPCHFYVIKDGTEVVAMFVISKGHLELDEDCKDDLKMKFPDIDKSPISKMLWDQCMFPSIEIDYLAVREGHRCSDKHIGSFAIREIMTHWTEPEYEAPLFLSVDAYRTPSYSAVRFYEKCQFWASEFPNPNIDTLRMFRIIDS